MARALVAVLVLTAVGCGDENIRLRLPGQWLSCPSDAPAITLAAAIIDNSGVARDVDCVSPAGIDLSSPNAVAAYYRGRGYVLRSITTTGKLVIGAYKAGCPAAYSNLKFCLVGSPFPPSTDQLDLSMNCKANCPRVP